MIKKIVLHDKLGREMKTFRLAIVVAVAAISICASGVYAADNFQRGGHPTGNYRGSGHYGGHYGGGGHFGGHHDGSHFSVLIGDPFWYPSWYYPFYYPYYYPYYPFGEVSVPSMPQEYIEQTGPDGSAATTTSDVWYYCPKSKTYYPYIKECPGGWQTVPASPETEPESPLPAQSALWYYCPGSKAYYPYIKECPGGWQETPAQSPSRAGR